MPTIHQSSRKVQGGASSNLMVDVDGDFAQGLLQQLGAIATWLKFLGTGNAGTSMGAVEFLAVQVSDAITNAGSTIAESIIEAARIRAEAEIERGAARAQRRPDTDRGGRLPDASELLARKAAEIDGRD